MSKASAALDKWLILRAYEQTTANSEPRPAEHDPDPNRRTRLRSPTGETGLPSDWLFSVATEPVLIVDAATQDIVQANPAAAELLGSTPTALIGAPITGVFEASGRAAISDSIEAARTTGAGAPMTVRAARAGAELSAKVSIFHAGADTYLLIRLESNDGPLAPIRSRAFDAIDAAAVGFLVTDAGLRVQYANQSFMDMVEHAPMTEMLGQSLVRWLEFSERDMAQLHNQMLQCQATSVLTARLRSERNLPREVEVCAVAVPNGQFTCWGFTIRELPRLN